MSIVSSLKSNISDFVKNSNNDSSITKKLESIGTNFKSTPSIIAKDLKVEGTISSSGLVEIEGTIQGTIKGNSVILREEGIMDGDILVESCSIRGHFNGKIRAKNVHITHKARFTGIIEYGSLSVEDGAYIDGQFKQIENINS